MISKWLIVLIIDGVEFAYNFALRLNMNVIRNSEVEE
jgi:hypothetical protein